jgi:DNA-binding IscR family transcriptional regulator
MSAVMPEQPDSSIAEFIFGDQQLHSRFSMAIELLARIVMVTPRSVSTTTLADELKQPLRIVRAVLDNLYKSGLVCQDEKCKDSWFCTWALGTITLADIFRCIAPVPGSATMPQKRKCGSTIAAADRNVNQQSVDLLLMQATMAINQVVLQHLQHFDLGRLRALTSTDAFRPISSKSHSFTSESY